MISHKELRSLVSYNPDDGHFRWLVKAARRVNIGDIAGSTWPEGYWIVTLKSRGYRAHRLAWFYVYEEWPRGFIDHIDRNRCNNRISNLRLADDVQNQHNCTKAFGASGIRGVYRVRNRWYARLVVRGKKESLGGYSTSEEAAAAYAKAVRDRFGEFAPIGG